MTKATKPLFDLPWRLEPYEKQVDHLVDAKGRIMAETYGYTGPFILEAVNKQEKQQKLIMSQRTAIADVINHVRKQQAANQSVSFRYVESRLLDAEPKKEPMQP